MQASNPLTYALFLISQLTPGGWQGKFSKKNFMKKRLVAVTGACCGAERRLKVYGAPFLEPPNNINHFKWLQLFVGDLGSAQHFLHLGRLMSFKTEKSGLFSPEKSPCTLGGYFSLSSLSSNTNVDETAPFSFQPCCREAKGTKNFYSES